MSAAAVVAIAGPLLFPLIGSVASLFAAAMTVTLARERCFDRNRNADTAIAAYADHY